LASILHDLVFLAAEARHRKVDCIKRINPLTAPWDAAEELARSTSASRGIPFTAFDPVLSQAQEILHELVQVAAGNEQYPFHLFGPRFTSIERRLKELGATYAGAALLSAPSAPLQPL
jgi:hypothetical protein